MAKVKQQHKRGNMEEIQKLEEEIKALLQISSDMRKAKEAYLQRYEEQQDAANKEIDEKKKEILSLRKQLENQKGGTK